MSKGPTYAQIKERRKWEAYHEAGHVVRAVAWQIPVRTVSLFSNPTVDPELGKFLLGTSTYRPPPGPDLTPLEVCIGLTICAAGEAAERRYRLGTRKRLRAREEADIVHAARGDRRNIQAYYRHVPEENLDEVLGWQIYHVDAWVERPETWGAIQLIAEALDDRGELNAVQIGAILQTRGTDRLPQLAAGTCTAKDMKESA